LGFKEPLEGLAWMGIEEDAAPVHRFTLNFSPMPRIAPPPLGSDKSGAEGMVELEAAAGAEINCCWFPFDVVLDVVEAVLLPLSAMRPKLPFHAAAPVVLGFDDEDRSELSISVEGKNHTIVLEKHYIEEEIADYDG
jgi:hypothetical protein